jgi:hypothetical protein
MVWFTFYINCIEYNTVFLKLYNSLGLDKSNVQMISFKKRVFFEKKAFKIVVKHFTTPKKKEVFNFEIPWNRIS